jgi:hypothetical protein
MLKLGYAEIDITPDIPMPLIGFNRVDSISRGILKPLLAQVAVWENADCCCLICIDSIGFAKFLSDSLRTRVAKVLNVSKDKVMLCFSHCHSAPDADSMTDYYEMVCRKIESATRSALSDMQPVLVGWTNVEAEIGVNRREGNSNIDKRVGILKICGLNNDMRLLLLRVTAHCNVLKRDNYFISPDYFGAIRDRLQDKYGCHTMVIQGAAGNIAPKYFNSELTPIDADGPQYVRSTTALEDMADAICEKMAEKIDVINITEDLSAKMCSRNILLNANVPSYEEAEHITEEAKQYCGIDGSEWLQEVSRLHNKGVSCQEENCEIQYFSIGQWCICGVPYELMVEFALEPVKILKNEYFYVNGYTNGCLSYFPTEEEFELGGYEVYWSLLIYYKYFNRVFPFEKESASKLIGCIVQEMLSNSVQ